MGQPTVANGLVAGLVAYAVSRGTSETALIEASGLGALDLSDPDGRTPLPLYVRALKAACERLGDTGFALRWAAQVGMADISILGLIMEASRTMGEAFLQLQRYERLAMAVDAPRGAPPRYTLEMSGRRLFMIDNAPPHQVVPELTEISFARLTCGPRRFLAQPHVLGVEFTHARPAHGDLYDEVFQCPVQFSASRNALELHPETASWPVRQGSSYVFGVLTERGDRLLEDLAADKQVKDRILRWLVERMHTGELRADLAARELGFSRQTLFRRLKAEGTTYSDTLTAARRRASELYLQGGRTSVADIAYLVGFSDAAAFSRAFKRWTGMSPQAYRDQCS